MEQRDYSKYEKISALDNELVRINSSYSNQFKRNDIESLADLFKLDDEDKIDYGKKQTNQTTYFNTQVKALCRLLKYKYLGDNLYIDGLLNKKIKIRDKHLDYPISSKEYKDVQYDFSCFGFDSKDFYKIISLLDIETGEISFSELFTTIASKTPGDFSVEKDREIFRNKVMLINKYIIEKQNTKKIDESSNLLELLEEEKRLIIELQKLEEQKMKINAKIIEVQQARNNIINKGIK